MTSLTCIPTSSIQLLPILYTFTNDCFILPFRIAIVIGIRLCFNVILFSISLMTLSGFFFLMSVGHLYGIFEEMSVLVLCPVLNSSSLFIYKLFEFLYILDNSSLSYVLLLNLFYHP